MMNTSVPTPSLLKVICEGCIKACDPNCPLCGGTRFYLWDPQTSYCYTEKREQIFFWDDEGEQWPVVRRQDRTASEPSPELASGTMLERIERWVSETPVRKWKLLLDENGWQSCVWFNRYKHSCVQISEPDFGRCVERTYYEIEKLQNKSGLP